MNNMSRTKTIDQEILEEVQSDAKKTRSYGVIFIISGLALQILHLFPLPIRGFPFMLIIAGIILVGSGILFILGSLTVPRNRTEIISRLQKVMLDKNPDRRLWAAQRLVGYAKEANFTKNEILSLAKHAAKMVKNPPVNQTYRPYVAVDHIILLREIAVSVPMDKHLRRDFVRIIKPLQNIEEFGDEAYEVLADAIAYHPEKLPVQAYSDLRKQKDELN